MEDATVNRMVEALDLFEEVSNSKWFQKTNMILFLNKRDLFMEKIKKTSISSCPSFEAYDGPNEYVPSADYVKQCFFKRNFTGNQVWTVASGEHRLLTTSSDIVFD